MRGLYKSLICGALSLFVGVGASYTYFSLNGTDEVNIDTGGTNTYVIETEPVTSKELFMENLLASSISVNELELVVEDVYNGEDLTIDFTGALSYDGLELAGGEYSSLIGNGTLSVDLAGINESIYFVYPGENTFYFNYRGQNLSLNLGTITSLFDILPIFGIELDSGTSLDNDIFTLLTAYLETLSETENNDGTYEYKLSIPTVGTISLTSDANHYLTGISTNGSLSIAGINVSLNASVEQSTTEEFVDPTIDSEYVTLDTLTNIISTIADLYNNKKLSTDFNLTINEVNSDESLLDINGDLIADFSDVSSIDKGKYSLNIISGGSLFGASQTNEIYTYYQDEHLYFALNDLIKGQMSLDDIDDIVDIVSNLINIEGVAGSALSSFGDFFESSAFANLINGNLSSIYEIINNVAITNSSLKVGINANSLNLGDFVFYVGITYENDGLNSISISDFIYEEYEINFDLNLKKYAGFAGIFENLETFKEYNQASQIFNTISKILNTKQLKLDYSVQYIDETYYNVYGSIGADVSTVDFNDLSTLSDGKYDISVNTNLNELDRNINLNYRDDTIYANYNNILKGYMSVDNVSDLFTFVDDLIGDDGNDTFTDIIEEIDVVLSDLLEQYSDVIEDIQDFNLRSLESYIDIDVDNYDNDSIKIDLYPNTKEGSIKVSFVVDFTEEEIEGISLYGLNNGNETFNVNLGIAEYSLETIEIGEYSNLGNLSNSIMGFTQNQEFNVSFAGNLLNNSTNCKTELDGTVQIEDEGIYGQIGLNAKLATDTNTYRHVIDFDYYYDDKVADDVLKAKYYGVKNYGTNSEVDNSDNPMRLYINKGSVLDIYDSITSIPDTSVLKYLFDISMDMSELISIDEGQFDSLTGIIEFLDESVKSLSLTDNSLTLSFDASKLGIDSILDLYVEYDGNDVTYISIEVDDFSGYSFNLELTFNDFDESLKENRLSVDDSESTYFDFNSLKYLIAVGINTTTSHTFELSGELKIEFEGLGGSIINLLIQDDIETNLTFKCEINEEDGSVTGYVEIEFQSTSNGYSDRTTRFYLDDSGDVIINQQRVESSGSWFWKSYTLVTDTFKVTADELVDNLLYYLLKYTLDISDTIYNQIDSGTSSDTSDDDTNVLNFTYENIISNYEYFETKSPSSFGSSEEESMYCFRIGADLSSIINLSESTSNAIIEGDLTIDIYHDSDNVLRRLYLYGTAISILNLCDIDIYLDVYNNLGTVDLSEYYDFIESYENDDSLLKGYYYYGVDESQFNTTSKSI